MSLFQSASQSQSYQVESLGDLINVLKESGAGKALLESGALIVLLMLGIALFFALAFWVLWILGKRVVALGKQHPEKAKTALLLLALVGGTERRKKNTFGRPKGPKV